MNKRHNLFPLPLLPVICAPAALFVPILITGKALFWGTPALQFIPWRAFGWAIMRNGQMPLWNPLVGMGAPLAANYQTAFFYPPNWIEALFWYLGGVSWQAWAATLLVMLHLIWAGIGASLLLRRLGAGILGQTIAGMAFGCSGYLVARAGFLSINAAVAWLPWILLATWSVVVHPSNRRAFMGLVIVLALQLLAGHAQTVWYSYLLAGLWAGFWGWLQTTRIAGQTPSGSNDPGWQKVFGKVFAAWGRLGLAVILAVGLASIQLLPTAEYLMQSQRSMAVDYELAMTYSFWPWRILGLFAPNLFGNPAHGDYWGYANFWEDAIYIGLLPALLALSVLLRPRRGLDLGEPLAGGEWTDRPLGFPEIRRRLAKFAGLVILVGLLLALGKNTPLFPWLYRYVPTFSLFNAPARFLIWVEIYLVVLAAMGADRWRRPEKWGLYWTRLATAGSFAVTLGAGIAWYLMTETKILPEIALSAIGATVLAGFWGLGAGALSLLAPPQGTSWMDLYRSRGQRLWLWAVVGMVGLDLVVAGWGLNPEIDLGFYNHEPSSLPEITEILDGGRLYLPADAERELKFDRFLRFDTFFPGEDWQAMRAAMLPNLNMLDGVASVNNFDPLISGRYDRWMEYLAQANSKIKQDWLNLMAVSVVEDVDSRSPAGVSFLPISSLGPDQSTGSIPARVRWVPCARFVTDGEAAWQLLISGNIERVREVVLEEPAAVPQGDCQAAKAEISVLAAQPAYFSVQVTADAPGWIVLADQWYPGWVGLIDNQPVTIERADFLFRAVQVNTGKHLVEFRYRPISFRIGAVITLGLLSGLLIFGIWSQLRLR